MSKIIYRDFHKLKILKGEARGNTSSVPSKKVYTRKSKHASSHSLRYFR